MLTKEECEEALFRFIRPYRASVKIQNAYYDINGEDKSIEDDSDVLYQLINEHFELVKENEELKNQLVEIESRLSRVSTQENSNPPLKFEELKPNMWVWDNKYKEYIKLSIINNILYYGNDEEYRFCDYIEFEENRFYLKEVK